MSEKLRVLDLFSGIGGFSLGMTRAGMRTIAFCEIEESPRSKLRKHWPNVPIFEDVRNLHAEDLPEAVDLICGGYPCQPFSLAGQRKGKDDDRHLWPEIVRIIRELDATTGKPTWGIFENVNGHVSMGLDQVLSDLENEGYTCWPFIIPACAVNAPHRRDRVWIVAHHAGRVDRRHYPGEVQRQEHESGKGTGSKNVFVNASRQLLDRTGNFREAGRNEFTDSRCASADTNAKHGDVSGLRAGQVPQQQETRIQQNIIANTEGWTMRDVGKDIRATSGKINPPVNASCIGEWDDRAKRMLITDANCAGQQELDTSPQPSDQGHFAGTDFEKLTTTEWITLPGVRPRNDGLPNRVARLKALGNAVVPQIPELIGKIIMEIEKK